ncbi:hypothetical protein HMPREF2857_08330 [Corynebacterium sp. HMSC076C10]|nr:hypothetical protein HMPREF2857_08330 [Corynebacterium sp. HMSC076C10]
MLEIERSLKRQYYSPLRYPGGKGVLGNYFRSILSDNPHLNEYIEPFAGGAGIAINLLVNNSVDKVTINDIDAAVFSFWRLVKNRPEELIKAIEKEDISLENWKRWKVEYKENYKQNTPNDELGKLFFFLNRTSRSGVINGGVIGGVSQNGRDKIDARFNKKSLISKIEVIGNNSSKLTVMNKDIFELLNGIRDNESTLIYLDPPYIEKGSKLYTCKFNDNSHRELSRKLTSKDSAIKNWMLSYDDVPLIHNLYRNQPMARFNLRYTANRSYQGNEVMMFSKNLIPSK